MATINYMKQEYFEEDRLRKMIKREEGFNVKREELPQPPMFYFPTYSYLPPPVLPWFGGMMRFPCIQPPFYPFNPVNRQVFPVQSFKKPFTVLKEAKIVKIPIEDTLSTPSVKTESSFEVTPIAINKPKKKRVRASACKNYIGLLCAGFSRAVLTSDRDSAILKKMEELLLERKSQLDVPERSRPEQLVETLKSFVHQAICGKKIKKMNRDRDFKIRNSEELSQLLICQPEDSEAIQVRKEILREMIDFFFDSDCYSEWLSKGMISESNRTFFIKNKKEIHKKFLNPLYYKPRFNHNPNEE